MTSYTEATKNDLSPEAPEPKATHRWGTARRCRAKEEQGGQEGQPRQKAPRAAKKAKGEKSGARDGTKTAKVLELLKQPGGVTAKELMKATGWQAHSMRGFLSGSINKKMSLAVISSKAESEERSYSIKA